MSFLRKWFGVSQQPPALDRDNEGRANPAVVPQGYVVIHLPAALPRLSDDSLEKVDRALNDFFLQHRFPFKVVVVQAQIEGVG